MATLPLMRSACAVTVGLALGGAALVGPAPFAGTSQAATPFGIAANEPEPTPPPPDPAPGIQGPVNRAPTQTAPRLHRRHIDGDPNMR